MKHNARHFFLGGLLISVAIIGAWFALSGDAVLAATTTDFGLQDVSDSGLDLGGTDIRVTIARVIRAVLGLLGIIAVVIVLYGGFLYMTSAGNADQIDRAKKILVNGAIGLAIILSAFAIVQFVLTQLAGATGFGGGTTDTDPPPGVCDPASGTFDPERCSELCVRNPQLSMCLNQQFFLKSITPSTHNGETTGMNNIKVRALFSHPIREPADISQALRLVRNPGDAGGGESVALAVSLIENGYVLEGVLPDGAALAPGEYTVSVDETIKNIRGEDLETNLLFGGIAYATKASFTVDAEQNDAVVPSISPVLVNGRGEDARVYLRREFTIVVDTIADVQDAAAYGGNAYVHLRITDADNPNTTVLNAYYDGPPVAHGSTKEYSFAYTGIVNPREFQSLKRYEAVVIVHDIDGNTAEGRTTFSVFGENCNNGVQDPGERGIDTGGVCGRGAGDLCTVNADCSEFLRCVENNLQEFRCTEAPVILFVDPWDGAPGNWVTVAGKHFGDAEGHVTFGSDLNSDGDVRAEDGETWMTARLAQCVQGVDTWTNEWAVVEVPALPELADNGKWMIGLSREADLAEGENLVTIETAEGEALNNGWRIREGSVMGIEDDREQGRVMSITNNGADFFQAAPGISIDAPENFHVVTVDIRADDLFEVMIFVETTDEQRPNKEVVYTTTGRPLPEPRRFASIFLPRSLEDGVWRRHVIDVNQALENAFPEENVRVRKITAIRFNMAVNSTLSIDNLRLVRSEADLLQDTTNDDYGPRPGGRVGSTDFVGFFTKTDVFRPGLCQVKTFANEPDGFQNISGFPDPLADGLINTAPPQAQVRAVGKNFGPQERQGQFRFGTVQGPVAQGNWSDTSVVTRVPTLVAGRIGVAVQNADGEVSNGLPFDVLDLEGDIAPPVISGIDPSSATRGSYITIAGTGFGEDGSVFAAPTVEAAEACFANPQAEGCIALEKAQCAASWLPTQAVVEVPQDAPLGVFQVMLQNSAGLRTDGQTTLTIIDGEPLPSICSIAPNSGSAPLPANQSLLLSGKNFQPGDGAPPVVHFGKRGYNPSDIATWLSSNDADNIILPGFTDRRISTRIPAHRVTGETMPFGPQPIKVGVGDRLSNSVFYDVQDCRSAGAAAPGQNMHCCQEGAEAGQWKQNGFACLGETRSAGYVYRFTTGVIPRRPRVLEQCDAPANEERPPSPSPWMENRDGTNVCVNASIQVVIDDGRGGVPVLDETTLTSGAGGTVRLFTCGQGAEPDCDNNKEPAADGYQPEWEDLVLSIRKADPAAGGVGNLAPNTWYHVELTTDIRALQPISVLGQAQTSPQPLQATRPCGEGTAYCFDFKTGQNNLCELVDAIVTPPEHTARLLGLVDNPPGSGSPLYYFVRGVANQACTALPVDHLPWAWRSQNDAQATAVKASDARYQNSRARVTANVHTAPESVDIIADLNTPQKQLRDESPLTIDLADPQIVDFWPSCSAACTNGIIGMTFNRHMITDTYHDGVTLEKCATPACEKEGRINVPFTDHHADYFRYELKPENVLEEDAWYMVTATRTIRAVARFGAEGEEDTPSSKGLEPKAWPFKTKSEDGFCVLDRAEVQPHPFVSRSIGKATAYRALAFGSPDACSPFGQQLDPYSYGWEWASSKPGVASVSSFQRIGDPPAYCSMTTCLPKGSDVARTTALAGLCGNGVVDAGEDCDIAGVLPNNAPETAGVSCSFSCLRPGNDAASCGNGTVEPNLGEECEIGVNGATAQTCTNRCVNAGSKQGIGLVNPDDPASLCGNGAVERGEDCDITAAAERLGRTCNASCLHIGTQLQQSWCAEQIADGPLSDAVRDACVGAKTVCGNERIEQGEECEIGKNGATEETCDARCLIQNACGTPLAQCAAGEPGCNADCTYAGASVAYSTPSFCGDAVVGAGESPMCTVTPLPANQQLGAFPAQIVVSDDDFNTADMDQETQSIVSKISARAARVQDGSSVRALDAPREDDADFHLQCGFIENETGNNCDNPGQGVGTNSCCYARPERYGEYPSDGAGFSGFQSKTQAARQAIQGMRAAHVSQMASFREQITPIAREGAPLDTVTNRLDASLQAFLSAPNDPDDPALLAAVNALIQDLALFIQELEKAQQVVATADAESSAALRSAFETLDAAVRQMEMGTAPANEQLAKELREKTDALKEAMEPHRFSIFAGTISADQIAASIQDAQTLVFILEQQKDAVNKKTANGAYSKLKQTFQEFMTSWETFEAYLNAEEKRTVDGVVGRIVLDPSVLADLSHIPRIGNPEQLRLSAEKILGRLPADAQKNTVHPYLVALRSVEQEFNAFSAVADDSSFANGVCRNTYIAVTFNKIIDEKTLFNQETGDPNLLIARGVPAGTACAQGEQDITDAARQALAFNGQDGEESQRGFWSNLWHAVKQFFVRLFAGEAYATQFEDTAVARWCSGSVRAVPVITHQFDGESASAMTTIRLNLDNALASSTTYAVILLGGEFGLRDVAGVGIKSPDGDARQLDDAWLFRTGSDICKLDKTVVEPDSFLFDRPNEPHTFTALARSTNGQFLSSIPGVYAWSWNWGPNGHPVFSIAAQEGEDGASESAARISASNEGALTAVATAIVTESTGGDINTAFTGTTNLTAMFCENPWPARTEGNEWEPLQDAAHNFQMHYCADAGVQGNADDDLPYLRSAVSLALSADKGERRRDFFTNVKNDDVIGVRVFGNTRDRDGDGTPDRLSAQEWLRAEFPDISGGQPLPIEGYEAVRVGGSVYINSLNEGPPEKSIYNNIVVLSVNENARPETMQVFDALLESLTFNINISNYGYCLSAEGNLHDTPELFTDTPCQTDFDCRQSNGRALDGKSGVCSNAKDKFKRDWGRLHQIRDMLLLTNTYYFNPVTLEGAQNYPTLEAGTFIPHYTNSRWSRSWKQTLAGTLGPNITLPQDPINAWSDCAADDKTNCWDAEENKYYCPYYAQVYEYTYDPALSTYKYHWQPEYFRQDASIFNEFLQGLSANEHLSFERGCIPEQPYSPFGTRCGDGVVSPAQLDPATGRVIAPAEQCDPPRSVRAGNYGVTDIVQQGVCAYSYKGEAQQCVVDGECGQFLSVATRPTKVGTFAQEYLVRADNSGVCAVSVNNNPVPLIDAGTPEERDGAKEIVYGFGCVDQFDPSTFSGCRDIATYGAAAVGGLGGKVSVLGSGEDVALDSAEFQNMLGDVFCAPLDMVVTGYDGEIVQNTCENVVGIPQLNACLPGEVATAVCNATCQIEYGMCQTTQVCGNGIKEPGEVCDQGNLNGTYGNCAGQNSIGVEQCQGRHPQFCGNGTLDTDAQGNKIEVCEKTDPKFSGFCSNIYQPACNGDLAAWTRQDLGTTSHFDEVVFVNETHGWIASRGKIFRTVNGGKNWSETSIPGNARFYGLFFIDEQTGWAVGSGKTVAKTTDGGETWTTTQLSAASGDRFFGVFFVTDQIGVLVGEQGEIFRTVNGGTAWAAAPLPAEVSAASLSLSRIWFVNDRVGWILGGLQTILKTTDGGQTWARQPFTAIASSGTYRLQALYYLDEQNGWVGGIHTVSPSAPVLFRTQDGGQTWTKVFERSGANFSFTDIAFANEQQGWAIGGKTAIFRTRDGGQHWEEEALQGVTGPDLLSLAVQDQQHAWAVGEGGALFTNIIDCDIHACRLDNECQTGSRCVAGANPAYHIRQEFSCPLNCQDASKRGYCGDGIVERDVGEQCDDKNTNNNDGCSRFCQVERASQTPAPQQQAQRVGRYCGDGITQNSNAEIGNGEGPNDDGKQEACDTGADLGTPCTPGYGKSCTWCRVDCSATVFVEAAGFCGNGAIDQAGPLAGGTTPFEQCDVDPVTGQVVAFSAANPDVPFTPQCSFDQVTGQSRPYHRGTYTCSNTCNQLSNDCVQCGVKQNDGLVPKIAVLNVMTGPGTTNATDWKGDTVKRLYRAQYNGVVVPETDGTHVLGSSNWAPKSGSVLFDGKIERIQVETEQQWILQDNQNTPYDRPYQSSFVGIEASPYCSDAYKIFFNNSEIRNEPSLREEHFTGGDFFEYETTNVAGRYIENELVITPTPPPGEVRVVVRWDQQDAGNVDFGGMVLNNQFQGSEKIDALGEYTRAQLSGASGFCNRIQVEGNPPWQQQYWSLVCGPEGRISNSRSSVMLHPMGRLEKNAAHAFTIRPGQISGSKFGFVVHGTSAIAQFKNKNLIVEVYKGGSHDDVVPRYSIYKPDEVYEIKGAAGTSSNPSAKYWYVFDIVDEGGTIHIRPPRGGGQHGLIRTDWTDVLNHYQETVYERSVVPLYAS